MKTTLHRPTLSLDMRAVLFGICGVVSIFASGGCRQKSQTEQVAATMEAARQVRPPLKAYVRLVDLVRASPLQADIQRLRAAQSRLLRFDTAPGASQGASVMVGYVLPQLTVGNGRVPSAAQTAAQARQKEARERLARITERNLVGFENEARSNAARRAAQKESERLAEEEIAGADVLRRARQAGERATREQVAGLTDPLYIGRTKNSVLQAQLAPPNPTTDTGLPPVLDEVAFEAEIAKLRADPKALGISERARLELRRRDNQARIDALEREIRQLAAQGAANIRSEIARLRAERLAKIKAEIAQLKQENDALPTVESARQSLAAVLTAEAGISQRAQSAEIAGAKNGGVLAPSLALGEMAGSTKALAGGDVVRAREAVARLRKQEQVLQALIVTDARESIRDNAQAHHVDVVVIEPNTAVNAPAAGRTDMTADFKRWFLSIGAGGPETEPARQNGLGKAPIRSGRPAQKPAGEEKA